MIRSPNRGSLLAGLALAASFTMGGAAPDADYEPARAQQGRVEVDADTNVSPAAKPRGPEYMQPRNSSLRRIPAHSPEWTTHGTHDPGTTLLESEDAGRAPKARQKPKRQAEPRGPASLTSGPGFLAPP